MATIDYHAHFVPRAYQDAIESLTDNPPAPAAEAFTRRFGRQGSAPAAIWNLDDRVAALDRAGIDIQLLSLGASQVWHRHERTRRDLTRAFNEGVLDAIRGHRGRFGLLASVSLPHVDAAIEESLEVAGLPDVAGFGITAHPAELPIDDPKWRPLLECWSDLRAVVLLHPDPIDSEVLWGPYWLKWGFGAVVEDALVALRLVTSGIVDEFPGIRWIVPHAGGVLAPAILRLETMRLQGRLPPALTVPLVEALRRLWFDTATSDPVAFSSIVEMVGADRLVLGTDFPLGEPGGLREIVGTVRENLGAHAGAVLARDLRASR